MNNEVPFDLHIRFDKLSISSLSLSHWSQDKIVRAPRTAVLGTSSKTFSPSACWLQDQIAFAIWLRDRDSNPNFHVQSVASYH